MLLMEGILMNELSTEEIITCAKMSGIDIPEHLLEQVAHNVNGTIEALDSVVIPGLERTEPLPIITNNQ